MMETLNTLDMMTKSMVLLLKKKLSEVALSFIVSFLFKCNLSTCCGTKRLMFQQL